MSWPTSHEASPVVKLLCRVLAAFALWRMFGPVTLAKVESRSGAPLEGSGSNGLRRRSRDVGSRGWAA